MKWYIFKKGGCLDPITNTKDWRNFVFNNKNCYMYIVDDNKIAEYLDVWQAMKENNIQMITMSQKTFDLINGILWGLFFIFLAFVLMLPYLIAGHLGWLGRG